MSVDYSASHGVGYEVEEWDTFLDDVCYDTLEEYVYNECGERFNTFTTNSGYDTETDGVFLIINKPFAEGLDLSHTKELLDVEVGRLKLETCGEFGIVGGMRVW